HFFTIYPRHRTLISVNKRHTGQRNKHFSFRHDWNSLISEDESLLFTHYSKEIFPSADLLVRYFQDYQKKLDIKVKFNTEVRQILRVKHHSTSLYQLKDKSDQAYYCRIVIVATGMWKPNIPNIRGIEKALGYENFNTNPEIYENKSILILGVGNSALETATSLYSHTQYVHLIARQPNLNLAWSTHYVGDIRAVNNNLLDTFLLKSLDGVSWLDLKGSSIQEKHGKYFVVLNEHYLSNKNKKRFVPDNFALRGGYDVVIRCLGFTFDDSIFSPSSLSRPWGRARKYPAVTDSYESVDLPEVFIAGTAAHSLDFKRSAGGFIHGFRYTGQSLQRLLEWRFENERWPSVTITFENLLVHILKRLNEGSGIYQMYGVLADVIIVHRDTDSAIYIEEFPIKLLHHLPECTGHNASEIIVVFLDYGWLNTNDNKFEAIASNAHLSYFLHPILYYFKNLPAESDFQRWKDYDRLPRPDSIHHVVEDFLVLWHSFNEHILPLQRWLEHVLRRNLRYFFWDNCLQIILTQISSPKFCQQFLKGQGLVERSQGKAVPDTRRVVMATLYSSN
ncbi:FAD-dependent oxidoreductase domain-containing protein 2, partial [Biomphalaria pfeifferi]